MCAVPGFKKVTKFMNTKLHSIFEHNSSKSEKYMQHDLKVPSHKTLIKKFCYAERFALSRSLVVNMQTLQKPCMSTPPKSSNLYSNWKSNILYIQIYTHYSMNNLLCTSICRTVAIALLTSAISVESSVKKRAKK